MVTASRKQSPPLSTPAAAALEIIKSLPPYQALTAPALLLKLIERRIVITASTLTSRVIPQLKRHGVINTRRIGYHLQQ